MKADLTRWTFRAEQHYAGTVQQQGRVPLDSDWNEQVEIQHHHDERETIDVVGATGVPKGPSFQVGVLSGDLQLSPGRAYVEGILCELDAGRVPVTVTGAGTLTPLTWTLDGLELRLGEWVRISTSDSDARIYRITAMTAATLTLTLGVGADNLATLFKGTPSIQRVVSYAVQPEWWHPDYTTWTPGAVPTLKLPGPGLYLAYLDVWRRHVTALEDSGIREIALGGPDTCTRMRTTWQMKLAPAGALTDPVTCASAGLPAPTSTGALSARALLPGNDTPCVLAPTARYRSLENQLYRVEIHDGGALGGTATFKYSADNGSIVTSWLKQDGLNLYVGSTGKDSVLGFHTGDWVEILDDSHELAGKPGVMALLAGVQTDHVTISDSTIKIEDFPLNPRIRKWDAALASVAQSGTDGFLTLGSAGVQIKFEPGSYTTGDHWMIPARTISTDVEWPKSELGTPLPRPRSGIEHHFMKLALVAWNGQTFTIQSDCRPQFPPLTDIHASDVKMDPGPCEFPPSVKTVQDAISALCQEKSGACCELVIAPGDDVREIVAAAQKRNLDRGIRGLHICFAAGTHVLRDTLTITAPSGGGDITVSGCGLAAQVRAPTVPTAIELVGWTTATVMDLNIAAGRATLAAPPPEPPPPPPRLTVLAHTDAAARTSAAVRTSATAPTTPSTATPSTATPSTATPSTATPSTGATKAAATSTGATSTGATSTDATRAAAPISASARTAIRRAARMRAVVERRQTLAGTLVLRDCLYGVVERVWSLCPPFPRRVTACITVSAPTVGSRASVRVTHCELAVGHHQVGVFVDGIDRSTIEGNRIEVVPLTAGDRTATLASHEFQGALRDRMMSDVRIGTAAGHTVTTLPDERRVHLTLNNVRMAFTADAAVAGTWSSYLARHTVRYLDKATKHERVPPPASDTSGGAASRNPVSNATSARVAMALKRLVTAIVREVSTMTQDQATAQGLGEFYTYVQTQAAALVTVMECAIIIGGAIAGDVRIADNSITGAINGIRAALHRPPSTTPAALVLPAPRIARARIAGNTMVLEGPRAIRSAGIRVASCASTIIEDNFVRHTGDAPSEGIQVLGLLGKMMRGQGNHVISTSVGIRVHPPKPTPNNDPSKGALWILSQNVAVDTPAPIIAPDTVLKVNNAP